MKKSNIELCNMWKKHCLLLWHRRHTCIIANADSKQQQNQEEQQKEQAGAAGASRLAAAAAAAADVFLRAYYEDDH